MHHELAVVIKDVDVILSGHFLALKKVTLNLPKQKIIGFIGPSGAGKTTLIRSIVGRQSIANGSIAVFDTPAGAPELRSHINYMTQEVSVYEDLTVAENFAYFATMYGIGRNDRNKEVRRLLTAVDLAPQAGQLVRQLSGGQKRRVSLAIALIGKPKLVVLDEPTVGLDPILREQLWRLFHTLVAEGVSVIITSHVMEEAERCDTLVLIRDGEVLAQGSPQELCKKTGTRSVEQSFLALVEGAK